MKAIQYLTFFERLFLTVMLFFTVTDVCADGYITDVAVIGLESGKGNTIKSKYRGDGWTVLDKDLNAGAHGWDIFLAYKTSSTDNPESGYITDICASTQNVNSFRYEGRTYYKAHSNSEFNGDMNRGSGGAFIYLYYTRDRVRLSSYGGLKRVMTKLSTTSSEEDGYPDTEAIYWRECSYSGICDVNRDVGGEFIYIQQHFTTQTLSLKNHPSFYSDLTYTGRELNLLENGSSDYGTMKYKVDDGNWVPWPRATAVGDHTVEYYLDGGTYADNSSSATKTVTIHPPVVKASSLTGVFSQADKTVTLIWSAGSLPGGYTDYSWVVYRGNTQIAQLDHDVRSYVDTQYENEKTETLYSVYYVSDNWEEGTKRDDAKATVTVNTTRTVPVNNLKADCQDDRVVLTWTSDGYEEGFGNKFKIYVGDDTQPINTITPTDYQTSFQWEHRSTDKHNDRVNLIDPETGVSYTEEPLNACSPLNYRVEGVIGDKTLNQATLERKAIGKGTVFYYLEASKGVYSGTVKLSWHVNRQGSEIAKTYIVERRKAESDEAWEVLHRMSSAEDYLFFTDETPLPGIYYDYQVTVQDKCDDGTIINYETTDIGYAKSTGSVSGRITYGSTGTSVMGADVVMKITGSSGETLEQYHSMYFTNTNGAVTWQYPSETYADEKLANGDFTVQLWLFPEVFSDSWFARFGENMALGMSATGQLCFSDGTNTLAFDDLSLRKNAYNHVALTRSGNTLTCFLMGKDADGIQVCKTATKQLSGSLSMTGANLFSLGHFKGFADEFRLWTKCLSEDEISENYDRLLVGNEAGLETYWTFDEGLRSQFFDYSRSGSTYHQHHGRVGSNAVTATVTPDDLALKAKTDKDGNYIIQGIPFTGEGTTYAVVPTMGVHEFNPTQALRHISNNSLVHNSVDFDDISSFPVRGVVYYEHTTIPVKDAYLYIDGIIASKDGESISTNDNGEFEVSVPIGDHFISVKLNGHEFLNGGRYPADPNGLGLRHTFDREISGLTFYDQTTAIVAGRVAGGDPEYQKPLGLGQGIANIGKAVLRLQLSNENGYLNVADQDPGSTVTTYDISDTDRVFQSQYGRAFVPGGKNYITVETDAETGEWVAQLPPLRYDVTSVVFPSRPESDAITSQDFSLPVIDATHPGAYYTDSVEVDGKWEKFNYEASAKMEYKSVSTIDLTENADGSFGTKSYEVKDINGKTHQVPLYATDEDGNMVPDADGNVQYTFGYPVYEELVTYKYKIYAYERYTNYDSGTAVVNEVPLGGKVVTIKNQYASTTGVVQESGELADIVDDKIELDSLGKATYKFTAGFPNIQAPYTRGLSISYDNDGTEMGWSGNDTFRVIVLGGVPTGNNFVTAGPDNVLMVLRDPPGSHSKTTWRKGTTTTHVSTTSHDWKNDLGARATLHLGVSSDVGVGGVGVIHLSNLQNKVDITAGGDFLKSHIHSETTVHTMTATQDISTSDSPNFVGAPADVFIGTSTNLLFGVCRQVHIKWNEENGTPEIIKEDVLAMDEQFSTFFNYTQYYIKETLIPNFRKLRNALLTKVSDVSQVNRPAKGGEPIYVTSLSEDDPHYGSNNSDSEVWGDKAVDFSQLKDGVYRGPSYTLLLPVDYKQDLQDMVFYYNEQIRRWEEELKLNEQAKVEAIENRSEMLRDNHSFSTGTRITNEVTTTHSSSKMNSTTKGINVVFNAETGYLWSGFGLSGVVHETFNKNWTDGSEDIDANDATMGYILSEDGDGYYDYLTVDVFDAPDDNGPIFYTRGGATSCPYEDEDVTQYYKPGTVIAEKTVQIEKPEIEVQTQQVTGIPAGGTGTVKLNIRNNSDTDRSVVYDLLVTPPSNLDGLSVMMDGVSLNRGMSVRVSPGETMVKTLTVKQTNPDILNYENVTLRMSSQCDNDPMSPRGEVADYASFSVYFQPTCSDIKLESSHSLVNTDTEGPVTLSMSGYNYSMTTLKGLRLQYKAEGDADFRTLQEYTKDAARLAADPNLRELPSLEGTSKLNYVIDLRTGDFADKTYVFRAITVCDQGGKEVNNESEELTIVRDMTRPMLIATPSPANGILTSADDLLITFNEDIQGSILTKPNNFEVVGVLNESEVAHDVALSLTDNAKAKTETTVNLSGKSFAVSFWMNYATDGTLLTHGTADNSFSIAIDGGKLAVIVADTTVTSTETLPAGKWLYMNVSYNADYKTVSAGYAIDASTVQLIPGSKVKAYECNGPVTLGGNGLSAKVQELSLWNGSRSMAEAQSTMYTTKNRYTEGLMAYWQFDEGHGTTATECVHNRHMTLPSQNAWWIDGDNYNLVLDGAHAAAADINNLNTTDSEDYLVETWFKADDTNTAAASIMSTPKMDLRLNAQGQMELELEDGDVTSVSNKNLADGQWHHLAVNVLKSTNGNGNIYLDGLLCKQIAGSAMPSLFGDRLILGGRRLQASQGVYRITQKLRGAIDELRIWKGRRTADVIKNSMFSRLTGDEAGLVAYYPLEKSTRDAYNQIVTTVTIDDAVPPSGDNAPPAIELLAADNTAVASINSQLSAINSAPLKLAPKMENVEFSFVASERQIKVNLEEQPAKIEGCTIYLTAKRVKDVNGNDAQPITWSVFVQQNKLRWQEADLTVNKSDTEAAEFTATIENIGSENETWSISGMPTWLSANTEGGSQAPLATTRLTFTVDASLPIGTYEATITLTGTQNIPTPLNITVINEGEAPQWEAVPGEATMTIVGVLAIDGIRSSDTRDMIGAFQGTKCVGVAQPQYFSRYDSYFVTIDIQGNSDDEGQPLQFQVYDASTGMTYPVVTATIDGSVTPVSFEQGALLGRYAQPVVFDATDLMLQSIALTQGWNWISLGVTSEEMGLDALLPNTEGDLATVKSRSAGYAIHDGSQWIGRLTAIDNAQMYMVQANTATTVSVTGTPVDPLANTIFLNSGWNWIPYTPLSTMSIADAFAGWDPAVDDIIKSQHAVAYYDGYEWVGSLRSMEPGKGYMALSANNLAFNYPANSVRDIRLAPAKSGSTEPSLPDPGMANQYSSNMVVLAQVTSQGHPQSDVQVAILSGNQCRSTAITDHQGKIYLTVPGDTPCQLTIKVKDGENIYTLPQHIDYVNDAVVGTTRAPYIINLDTATGIEEMENGESVNEEWYDLVGRKLNNTPHQKGIYIVNGNKRIVNKKQ